MFRLINKSGSIFNSQLLKNINSSSVISISTITPLLSTTTTSSVTLSNYFYSTKSKSTRGSHVSYVAPLKSSRKERGGDNNNNYNNKEDKSKRSNYMELKQKSSSKSTSLYGGSKSLSSTSDFKSSNSITRSTSANSNGIGSKTESINVNNYQKVKPEYLKNTKEEIQKEKRKQLVMEKRKILFEKKDSNVILEELDQDTTLIQNKSKYTDNLDPSKSGTGIAFSRLGLRKSLVDCLKNQFDITIPSLIQQLAIPEIIKNSKDVLFVSQTGTGKTLTYLLPIIQNIKRIEQDELIELKKKEQEKEKVSAAEKVEEEEIEEIEEKDEEIIEDEDEEEIGNQEDGMNEEEKIDFKLLLKRAPRRPKAIILVPTRELAIQVMGVAKKISHDIKFSCTMISSGGGDINKYTKKFKKLPIDVLVATPGSLNKLIESKKIYFSKLRHIVIDEADTMFTVGKGFESEIDSIVQPFKYRLQNKVEQGTNAVNAVICSATLTNQLMKTINESFPVIDKLSTPTIHRSLNTLEQRFINIVGTGDKHQALLNSINSVSLVDKLDESTGELVKKKTLIFCNKPNSCRSTEYFLSENKFKVTSLHGEIPPATRSKNWKLFLSGNVDYLVATDIASRGIDISSIDHVILFDFPSNPIDYIHRIGRTARAGNKGLVTNLITKRDKYLADSIKESIRKGYSLENLSSSHKINNFPNNNSGKKNNKNFIK